MAINFRPMLKQLHIVDKDGLDTRLALNWGQEILLNEVHRQWNANKPVRIIILKARQIGISTISEGILFCMSQMFHNMRGRVVAHDNDSTQGLLEMSSYYWDSWAFNKLATLKYNSRNELAWVENKSSIRVSTAKNTRAGRGKTLRALHASEVAFWENPDILMLGLTQAIPNRPGTFIALESTANGLGNWFHKTWMAAEEGEISYVPIFLPWFRHPEYTAHFEGLNVPSILRLDDEEKFLRKLGIDDSRLIWRRQAIKDKCNRSVEQFHQEYPTNPEEAFISTGSNVFDYKLLQAAYEPKAPRVGRLTDTPQGIKFIEDPMGPLSIYSLPSDDSDWGQYMIGGDSTKATRGDYSCAQVINRRTLEQVAVWRAKATPMHFGRELAWLGTYYNQAMLAPEIQGGGYATIGYLQAVNYPNIWRNRWAEKIPGAMKEVYGWESTVKTKHWALGALLKALGDEDVKVHDKVTFAEMTNFISLPDGTFGPAEGEGRGHDDTVLALAIAVVCHLSEPVLPPYSGSVRDAPEWHAWQEFMDEEYDREESA